jgi:DnaJ-class molecular chaperone
MIVPLKKNRPARRVMRRAAVVALLAGEPVCSVCGGWGTLDSRGDKCSSCAGQGVSASVAADLSVARELLGRHV